MSRFLDASGHALASEGHKDFMGPWVSLVGGKAMSGTVRRRHGQAGQVRSARAVFCAAPVQGCLASTDEATGGQGTAPLTNPTCPSRSRRLHLLHAQRLGTVLHHLRTSKGQRFRPCPLIVEAQSGPAFETRNHTEITTLADGGSHCSSRRGIWWTTPPTRWGNEEAWNAGYCCADAIDFEIDDVDYLRRVIAQTVTPCR